MADFTLEALKDEIELDPEGIGYKNSATSGDWKGDQVIADLINLQNLKVDRASIQMEDVRGVVTFDAYDTLSIDEQEWLRWITPNGGAMRITADTKLQFSGRTLAANGVAGTGNDDDSMWAAAHDQDMAPAFLAMIEVDGSRAEVLWGDGVTITTGNVGHSFNLI